MTEDINICKEIKAIIMEHLPQILSLRSTGVLKSDNTFVSKGDILCQNLIITYLMKNISNCKIISEETENITDDLTNYEYIVTIDPIDGTENFVSGLKEWGVGISIYRHMIHYQSMILLPELGLHLCTHEKVNRRKGSRICGLSSYMKKTDFESLDKNFEYRIMGCCMYNMYNVITGAYCHFTHLKGCYSWDVLPGFNLALENGLDVVLGDAHYKGEFLLPNVKYFFEVH